MYIHVSDATEALPSRCGQSCYDDQHTLIRAGGGHQWAAGVNNVWGEGHFSMNPSSFVMLMHRVAALNWKKKTTNNQMFLFAVDGERPEEASGQEEHPPGVWNRHTAPERRRRCVGTSLLSGFRWIKTGNWIQFGNNSVIKVTKIWLDFIFHAFWSSSAAHVFVLQQK